MFWAWASFVGGFMLSSLWTTFVNPDKSYVAGGLIFTSCLFAAGAAFLIKEQP